MACGYGINAKSSELQAANLGKDHVNDLKEVAAKHRRLLGMKKQGSLQDTLPLPCRMCHAVHVCRCLEQRQQPPTPFTPGQPKPWPGLKHIPVTLATWVAVWEVYLDPKWARQRLGLYGGQDRALEQFFKQLEEEVAEVSMERHGHAKQLVVFLGTAGIGSRGGWGADAVLQACCKVVCRPRGTGQRRGRVVLVDEHCTSRVSSAVNGQQEELDHEQPTRPAGWKPPAGQVEHRLVRPALSQQRDQPVRGLMRPPGSSQAATQPAASEPGPSTPTPAKRNKRTKAEQAAEPTQPTKGKGKAKGKSAEAKPAP
ncbi:hypothetical protein QJQ45_010165 [Haematococcus lacustris]|nr:hypothetical protein QJQ45_010165 [Haematococcus lacustris]